MRPYYGFPWRGCDKRKMVKVGWVTCPRCRGVFDIDKSMLDVDGVYFHCPYCQLEPIRPEDCEINLGGTKIIKGKHTNSAM